MKHSRKNRFVRKPFSSRTVPAALRPAAGAVLALAAFLTLSPASPLLMEAAAQNRPVAINANPGGPVLIPGVGFSPGLSAGGVSAPLSTLGNASLPKGLTLERYAAPAAPTASRASLALPAAGPAALVAVAPAARSNSPVSLAGRSPAVPAVDGAMGEAGLVSIYAGRTTPVRTDPTTIRETGGGAAAALDSLRLGEKAAAATLSPRTASEESAASIGRPFDASRSAERTADSSFVQATSRNGAARTASLERADARPADAAAKGPPSPEGSRSPTLEGAPAADVPAPASEDASPRRSVSRAAKYGLVTGALMLAFNFTASWAAETLGYVPHSNYEAPALPEAATLGDAGSLFFMAAVMAPIVEEIVFRAGLLSGIEWLTRKAVRRGAGIAASVLSSAIFVVLHETADPFLIGVRLAGALLMAYTYKREGLLASIVLHAVNNGVLIAGMLLSSFLAPGLSMALGGVSLALGAGAAAWAARGIFQQRADRREGRIGRYELTSRSSLVLAALLGLGALLLAPKLILVNLPFVAGLGFYAWRKRKA
ncbi:MAG: CPBP family glutamic-type intramembrane protease [Elusimicrobiota bacterium]